jgi:dihydroanticapsin dehydrogenase
VSGRLDSKRVVITGAAANIGRATALLFGAEGAKVVIGDVDERAEQTADAIRAAGGDGQFVRTDVTSPEEMQALIDGAAERLGGLDVLVNNAGRLRTGSVTDFSIEEWDTTMAVNARSCFLGARFAVPHMRAAGGGSIINTSSQVGLHGAPGGTGYSASKGAILAFTKGLALELAGDGIRVNAVCPGWIDTPFNDPAIEMMGGKEAHAEIVKATVPMGRQGRPDEIADGMLYLASDESSFMTGQVLAIDGGIT